MNDSSSEMFTCAVVSFLRREARENANCEVRRGFQTLPMNLLQIKYLPSNTVNHVKLKNVLILKARNFYK